MWCCIIKNMQQKLTLMQPQVHTAIERTKHSLHTLKINFHFFLHTTLKYCWILISETLSNSKIWTHFKTHLMCTCNTCKFTYSLTLLPNQQMSFFPSHFYRIQGWLIQLIIQVMELTKKPIHTLINCSILAYWPYQTTPSTNPFDNWKHNHFLEGSTIRPNFFRKIVKINSTNNNLSPWSELDLILFFIHLDSFVVEKVEHHLTGPFLLAGPSLAKRGP